MTMIIRLRWRSLPQIHLNFPSPSLLISKGARCRGIGPTLTWGGGRGTRYCFKLLSHTNLRFVMFPLNNCILPMLSYKAWVCEYKYRSYPFLFLSCCTQTPGQTLPINLAGCSKTSCVVLPWRLRSSFTFFLFLNWRSSEPSLRPSGVRLTQVGQQSGSLGEHLAFKVPPWLSLRPT